MILDSFINSAASIYGQNLANQTNREIANANLAYQREANERNIQFTKDENELTRLREDNAVQRAALDMERAGLSKTLAAGNPASAQSLNAPQQQALHDDYRYENIMKNVNLQFNFAELGKQIAEIRKIQAETEGQNIDNKNAQIKHNTQIEYTSALTDYYSQQSHYQSLVNQIEEKYGMPRAHYQINQIVASAINSLESAKLSRGQVDKVIQDRATSLAQENNLKMDAVNKLYQAIYTGVQAESARYNLDYFRNYKLPLNFDDYESPTAWTFVGAHSLLDLLQQGAQSMDEMVLEHEKFRKDYPQYFEFNPDSLDDIPSYSNFMRDLMESRGY